MSETEIRVLPLEINDLSAIKIKAADKLGIDVTDIKDIKILRRSLDARGKMPIYQLRVSVSTDAEFSPEPALLSELKNVENATRVLIIGAGPAGYFAALELITLGLKPIIIERGKDVQARRRDLRAIQQFGIVNPNSNYCFGEGGAGTYSDGKLYTRSHKRGSIEKTLRLLVEHGAPSDILIDAHPHIGSNKLPIVVQNMRETILKHGGEVHFDSCVTNFVLKTTTSLKNQEIIGVIVNGEKEFFGAATIVATGHSARDIYALFHKKNILTEAKPFALGVRIEHPQPLIDSIQYNGKEKNDVLPAASYSLVCQVQERGVFSFCMCPGGLVVPSATSPGEIVVNGMSMSRRDSPFANSGTVVAVELEDIKRFQASGIRNQASGIRHQESGIGSDVSGIMQTENLTPDTSNLIPHITLNFQRHVEQNMFNAGDGSQKAPAQRLTDFVSRKKSSTLPDSSYIPGLFSAELNRLLPNFIYDRLREGVIQFGKMMRGYFTEEAVVMGTESRTSSPIRIPRDAVTLMHPEIKNLFPCGEGAGYAGGIISAAMDGQNVARGVAVVIKN